MFFIDSTQSVFHDIAINFRSPLELLTVKANPYTHSYVTKRQDRGGDFRKHLCTH